MSMLHLRLGKYYQQKQILKQSSEQPKSAIREVLRRLPNSYVRLSVIGYSFMHLLMKMLIILQQKNISTTCTRVCTVILQFYSSFDVSYGDHCSPIIIIKQKCMYTKKGPKQNKTETKNISKLKKNCNQKKLLKKL